MGVRVYIFRFNLESYGEKAVLGPVIPKTFKNGSGLFLHGTHDEGGTTTHNWSARCQYNVTGWVSM